MPRSAGRVPAPLQAATPQAGVGLALHAVLKAAASKQGRKSTQGYVASGYTASLKQLKPLLAGGAHCSHPRLSPTLAPSWGAAVKQLLPCPKEPTDLFQREKMFFPYEKQLAGRADAQKAAASAVIRGETRGQEAPRCPATGLLPLSPRHAVLPHFSFYLTSVPRGSSLILLLFLYSSAHVVLHKTFRERAARASARLCRASPAAANVPAAWGHRRATPGVWDLCPKCTLGTAPKLHVGLGDQPARSSMRLLSQRGKKIKNKGLTSFI